MKKLTTEFNTASVKKGDIFQIELFEGGFMGDAHDVEVVSGKVTLLQDKARQENFGLRVLTFKAEEEGEVEIVARHFSQVTRSARGRDITFKVKVS